MDSVLKISIPCKFSDFAVRSLLSAGGPFEITLISPHARGLKSDRTEVRY